MTATPLSQGRKVDRATMAQRMAELAARHGAAVSCTPTPLDPQGVSVRIEAARASVSMGFTAKAERKHGGWGYLGHWVCRRGNLFTPAFQGYSWPRPHHKATASADTFEGFETVVDRMLGLVVSGHAFAEPEQ